MHQWGKFNETSLPEEEDFYSYLNMEDITDVGYKHTKRICKDFDIENLSEHQDSYLKSDTLLLADVFENFRKTCLELYLSDPARFPSVPKLAWQAVLKKTEVKLELLTDIDMLLMVEKGIRGETCHFVNRYAKANIKCMKDYDKTGIMENVVKDIFLKLISNTQENYMIFTMIYQFTRKNKS